MNGTEPDVVAVIGAGPAGLAAAASLRPLGLRVRVLEQAEAPGWRWRHHYDRLHLHTTRRLSALPGLPIPASYGRWVSRDDFVRYLEAYVQHHALAIELGTTVLRVERAPSGYRVDTSRGSFDAKYVIVCGGYNNVAFTPDWPGRGAFSGELIHSQAYRNGESYRGKRVIVAGSGNSGAEIATDLVEHGAEVYWSFRSAPNIVPRSVLGVATQGLGIMLRPLSPAVVDPIVATFELATVGDLTRFGVPRPTRGAYTAVVRDRVLPVLDVGVVAAIKQGKLKPIGAIASFDESAVVLESGDRVAPNAVIACTGFRPALEPLVDHLGVLDAHGVPLVHGARQHASAPGLFFLGYTNAISGNLREIAQHARKLHETLSLSNARA